MPRSQYLRKRSDLFKGQSPTVNYLGTLRWSPIAWRGWADLRLFAKGLELAPQPPLLLNFNVPYWQVLYADLLAVEAAGRNGLRLIAADGDVQLFVSSLRQQADILSDLSSLGAPVAL